MNPASFGHLRRLAARARKRLSSRALILLYHRVAESISDPWSLAVKPAHFAEHLEVIKKRARVMSVRELVAAIADGKLPRRAVVSSVPTSCFPSVSLMSLSSFFTRARRTETSSQRYSACVV